MTMASTSSHIKANWFFSFKKAQNPPLVDIFIFWIWGSILQSSSLYCYVSISLKAFLYRGIASSINPELRSRYGAHPPSPSFIMSSRTNRDCVPWTIVLQSRQVCSRLFRIFGFPCQKLNELMFHPDGITYIFHVGDIIIQSTGLSGFRFSHLFNMEFFRSVINDSTYWITQNLSI